MTIREVIDMLVLIFKSLAEIFGPLFSKSEDDAEGETEAPEATV